nr:hypothetical protein [Amycolatopsis sp. FDAARGOS 1241]
MVFRVRGAVRLPGDSGAAPCAGGGFGVEVGFGAGDALGLSGEPCAAAPAGRPSRREVDFRVRALGLPGEACAAAPAGGPFGGEVGFRVRGAVRLPGDSGAAPCAGGGFGVEAGFRTGG